MASAKVGHVEEMISGNIKLLLGTNAIAERLQHTQTVANAAQRHKNFHTRRVSSLIRVSIGSLIQPAERAV